MNNANYNKRITIYSITRSEDTDGFMVEREAVVLQTYAKVKTTKGYTLIANNTDFEKSYTNFTIRYPKTNITRDMLIKYNGKDYSIEYLNDINEEDAELEIQAKEVTK